MKKWIKQGVLWMTALALLSGCASMKKSQPQKTSLSSGEVTQEGSLPLEESEVRDVRKGTNPTSQESNTSRESETEQDNTQSQEIQTEQRNRESQEGETGQESREKQTTKGEVSVCRISISCDTINNQLDKLEEGKESFVPEDGWILYPSEIAYEDGDTAFSLLQRACRQARIQMEYTQSPVYETAYIEGINQIYEMDCGPLSGWMYKVNDVFPNYGSGNFRVSPGDEVEWIYTCDLGQDIGGGELIGGAR